MQTLRCPAAQEEATGARFLHEGTRCVRKPLRTEKQASGGRRTLSFLYGACQR